MDYICFQLEQIPDLSLLKYQALADTGILGVLKRHENFLRQWHGICLETSTNLHLIYIFFPDESIGQRLKVFFLMTGEKETLKRVALLLKKSPLCDFFALKQGILPEISFKFGATLIKKERLVEVYNSLIDENRLLYYVPKWDMNPNARLYDLFKIMEILGESSLCHKNPCAFRVDLFSISIEQEVHNTFLPFLKRLRGDNNVQLVRETERLRVGSDVTDVCKEYEDWLKRIETEPHFKMHIYGFAENLFSAKMILNAAGSESLDKGDFTIKMIEPDLNGKFTLLSRIGMKKDYSIYSGQEKLKFWPTTYCLSEVVPFFRFPVLYEGEMIEIPKESSPVYFENGIYLGKDKNGYSVFFLLQDLARHCFFTGMPGSGKTNSMLHLATELKKKEIPFLIMEPAKKEYRALLGDKIMRDTFLFSPHLQSKFPLSMNPLEFPKGVRVSEHINALLEVFEGTFLLEGPTYKFLSDSIQKAYTDYGWDIEEINTKEKAKIYPCLQDVYNNLQKEIEISSYSNEIKGNIRAFLQVRLGGLMERDSGNVFNVYHSTLKPEEWIQSCAIVELETLGEQAKSFFVLLVCHYILETLRSNIETNMDKMNRYIRHTIFIEEAHNIIARGSENADNNKVNPKISATAYIIKMLAEVRAMKEAIIIADQLPTAIASEVTKNTGLKLVHRLTAADDRKIIGDSISASPMQQERMASFSCGQAFIYHEKTMKPFEIQVAKWLSPNNLFDITNDEELYLELCDCPTVYKSVCVAIDNLESQHLEPIWDGISSVEKKYCESNFTNLNDLADKTCVSAEIKRLSAECNNLLMKYKHMKSIWYVTKQQNHILNHKLEETFHRINGTIKRIENLKRLFNIFGER